MSNHSEPLVVRSGPGTGLGVFRHLVLNWLLAQFDGVPLWVQAEPAVLDGLRWLEVPHEVGFPSSSRRRVAAEWDRRPGDLEVGDFLSSRELGELQREGFLSEVVLCALAQSGWRRGEWAHITRGELLIRFTPEGLLADPVALDLEQWREFNRVRLQELAPHELLKAVSPWLSAPRDPRELEAAILLCVDEVSNLVELAERLT